MNSAEYINLIVEYREVRGFPAPTKEEIQEWTAEWSKWNNRRRQKEMDKIKAHLTISKLDLAKR